MPAVAKVQFTTGWLQACPGREDDAPVSDVIGRVGDAEVNDEGAVARDVEEERSSADLDLPADAEGAREGVPADGDRRTDARIDFHEDGAIAADGPAAVGLRVGDPRVGDGLVLFGRRALDVADGGRRDAIAAAGGLTREGRKRGRGNTDARRGLTPCRASE